MTGEADDDEWARAVACMRRRKHGDARIYALWAGSKAFDAGVEQESPPAAPLMPIGVCADDLVVWWLDGWKMAQDNQVVQAAAEAEMALARHRPARLPYADD